MYRDVEQDSSDSTAEIIKPTRSLTRFVAMGLLAFVALAILTVLVLVPGFIRAKMWEPSSSASQNTKATTSVSRFLQSDDLMSFVASRSIQANPTCRLNSELSICNATFMKPLLVKHANQRQNTMPEILLEFLSKLDISPETQEVVKAAIGNLADPFVQTLAQQLASEMPHVEGTTAEEAMQKLTNKLSSSGSQMQQYREKLFPNMPSLSDTEGGKVFQTALTSNGVRLEQKGTDNSWKAEFEIGMPRTWNLTRSLMDMPSAHDLEAALFAPGSVPLKVGAPKNGPPPPDDLAGDIVAACFIPLSHLIMCALHHEGKVTLPYWAKIVITVEDVLTMGATTLLGPIGLIIDLVFCWTPRGYHYGPAKAYPAGFVSPWIK